MSQLKDILCPTLALDRRRAWKGCATLSSVKRATTTVNTGSCQNERGSALTQQADKRLGYEASDDSVEALMQVMLANSNVLSLMNALMHGGVTERSTS